jgi:hypothetical protein
MVDPTNPIQPHRDTARPDAQPPQGDDPTVGERGLIGGLQSTVTIEELIARHTPTTPDQIAPIIRAAFVGRTSTDDNQDPTLSIPRQVTTCQAKLAGLPIQVVIVAYYWDIETGRLDLDQRGHSTSHEKFNVPVPRDGSITD